MKNLFKFRQFNFWRFSFYLFEQRRWTICIGLDCTEWPLLWFSFIFIHLEVNLMKGFKEWKNPSSKIDYSTNSGLSPYEFGCEVHKSIFNNETSQYEDVNERVERILKKFKEKE